MIPVEVDDVVMVSALSPVGRPPEVVPGLLAPRLGALDGKRVFLVNCRLRNSRLFVEQLAAWFGDELPSVEIEVVDWAGTYLDDPELAERIRAEGDAAVFAIGTCSTCAPMVATHAM